MARPRPTSNGDCPTSAIWLQKYVAKPLAGDIDQRREMGGVARGAGG